MDEFLPFLTGNLKKNKITVDSFCKEIGISRQKFYRYVREPRRFTDENIRSIIKILSLDDADTARLKSYLYPKSGMSAPGQNADYGALISELLKRRLSEELLPEVNSIEYTASDGTVSMESAGSMARILSGCSAGSDPYELEDTPLLRHEYEFTIYNCIPGDPDDSCRNTDLPDKSILTIACTVKELDDMLSRTSSVHIRVRHYLAEWQQQKMQQTDIGDSDSMCFNLKLLNVTLPLQTLAEDYLIDWSDIRRRFWTENINMCLIKHTAREDRGADHTVSEDAGDDVPSASGYILTEYYIMVFSEFGDCRACRLGSEDMSHLYRFFSIDCERTSRLYLSKQYEGTPNQIYQQLESEHRSILIHPDLCFDDIPREIWNTILAEIGTMDNACLCESLLRRLIDPHDQYSFLSFEEIATAAIETLHLRYEGNARMGRIVICHPDGLANLVQTGIITDLIEGNGGQAADCRSSSPLRFSDSMIRELLLLIRSSILRRMSSPVKDPSNYDWVNYYILHPQFPYPETSFVVYDNFGVIPIYSGSRHRHTNIGLFRNSATGTLMYNYLINEMIGRRGEKLSSDILSDEHSLALLDKLLGQLD